MGGNAIKKSSRINAANLDETYRLALEIFEEIGLPTENMEPLGSYGKKGPQGTYGDIDISVPLHDLGVFMGAEIESLDDLKEFGPALRSKIESEGFEAKWIPGARVMAVGTPIVNVDGEQPDAWAQVDLMPSPESSRDYQRWVYSAPDYGQSDFKGAHRNLLLEAIASVIFREVKETETVDGAEVPVVWDQFSLRPERGLYRKTLSRRGKRGLLKNPKTIEREYYPFSMDKHEIVRLLLGEGFEPGDFKSFESIWGVISDPTWEYYALLPEIKATFIELQDMEIPEVVL